LSQAALFAGVPELDGVFGGAHGEDVALLDPGRRADVFGARVRVVAAVEAEELRYFFGGGVPDEELFVERDR
jgi:hypothetical protein